MISLLLSATLLSEPSFSMMLSPEERGIAESKQGFTLNGILYQSEDQWTIWINNTKYQPGDYPDQFLIRRVSEQDVEIDFNEEIITLKIGETKHTQSE